MGTPEFGAIVLKALIKSGHKPFLVFTEPDKPVGRKQILTPSPVKVLAGEYNIPVVQPEKISQFADEIEKLKPSLIIIASFGQIIPKKILEIPQDGCLNVHPSLLPKYRGPSPIQSAIINGDEKTGVTIMRVSEKIDAGPILSQKEIEIDPKETYESLHDKLAEAGVKLLLEVLPKLSKGQAPFQLQDDSKATYTKILKRSDGEIDWGKSPKDIERQIRAFNPWPGTYTFCNGKRLKILKAEAPYGKLEIKEVQLEGKKPMSYKEFLRGYPDFKLPC